MVYIGKNYSVYLEFPGPASGISRYKILWRNAVKQAAAGTLGRGSDVGPRTSGKTGLVPTVCHWTFSDFV